MGDSLTPPAGADNAPRRTSVYLYYDEFDSLIYVGITNRGTLRQREHNDEKVWWPFVTRQEVEHHDTRDKALAREKRLIQTFRPPFNRQHNPDSQRLRQGYLDSRSALDTLASSDAMALELGKQMNRRLPLYQLTPDADGIGAPVLITAFEHAPIAARLRMPGTPVPFHGTGQGHGIVESITRQGPLAVIRLSRRTARPVVRAWGFLRFPPAKPHGSVIVLSAVSVTLEPKPNPWVRCVVDRCPERQSVLDRCVEHAAGLVVLNDEEGAA